MPESAQELLAELTAAGLLSADEATKFDREIAVGVEALLERLVKDGRITQYQADKFLAGKSSDIYFGDYIVLEELGRGGMGTVLLARHRRMDREVAIKVLPMTTLESADAVARFYQEVKVAAKLTHPNIVHAYDAGEHHGFHYLVMEYVRGHDLARVLQQLGPIPVSLAIDYISQAAAGLEYAHNKGVVHRDVKPSNLLLDNEGVIKILDMGLARIGGNLLGGDEVSEHLTTTGQVMGTVEYMSPEQAEDTRAADCRSDIYSLGCTLYRLLTGTSPFSRETMVKTILAHREAPIPSLPVIDDINFAHVDRVFKKMVAKKPADRYQTTTELLLELRQLDESVATSRDEATVDLRRESLPAPAQPIQISEPQPPDVSATIVSAGEAPPITSSSASVPAYAAPPSSSSSETGLHHIPEVVGGPDTAGPSFVILKPHRGKRLLIIGAIAVLTSPCLVGGILGVIVWIFAKADVAEMDRGYLNPSGLASTNAAKVLGMIAAGLAALTIAGNVVGGLITGW